MGGGRLIVFEGAEGAGKSTQLRLVSERISAVGSTVVAVREPGGTIVGDEIRRLLLDPSSDIAPRAEALLFMASRAQLVEREIRPALAAGHVVLVDRFFLSTYAYQGAGRGLPVDELRAANGIATSGLVPDLTLLLRMPVEDGLDRALHREGGARDRMEGAELAFHERVANAFTQFASQEWQRAHPGVRTDRARRCCVGTEETVLARVLNAHFVPCGPEFSLLVLQPQEKRRHERVDAVTRDVRRGGAEQRAGVEAAGWSERGLRGLPRRAASGHESGAHLLDQVLGHVARDFVDTLSDSTLYTRTADGLVHELHDPHSSYLSPQLLARLSESTSGRYAGVGAQIDVRDGWITIVAPLPGGPAVEAGIQTGDRIIEVDGKPIHVLGFDEARNTLRGPPGSVIRITIERPGVGTPIKFALTRRGNPRALRTARDAPPRRHRLRRR